MDIEQLARLVIGCALRVHTRLGPGLLESVYERVLADELRKLGLVVETQVRMAITFEGKEFNDAFRADLIVNGMLLIEIKSVERLAPVHIKQTLTYLRLTGLKLGLVFNFGEASLKNGIKRVVNGL